MSPPSIEFGLSSPMGILPLPDLKLNGQMTMTIMELNIKAKYTLTCAQSKNKYKKIYKLRTAKEIWESLSINDEDTEDVKLRKVMTLTRRYERFIMKDGEFVDGMFRRLQVLLNNLGTIGHMYSKDQINLKGLDSFPKVWEPKTTTIQKTRDIKKSCIG